MDFDVSCRCGQTITVTEGAAGSERSCTCGNRISIPSLAALRESAGLSAMPVNPWQLIDQQVRDGVLPPPDCIACGMATDDVLPVVAECERRNVRMKGGVYWPIALLTGGHVMIRSEERLVSEHGRDLSVKLPIRVCAFCRKAPSHRVLLWFCRVLRYVFPVIGIALLATSKTSLRGLWFFAVPFLILGFERLIEQRESNGLKHLVSQVPLYAQLLRRFPDARVTID